MGIMHTPPTVGFNRPLGQPKLPVGKHKKPIMEGPIGKIKPLTEPKGQLALPPGASRLSLPGKGPIRALPGPFNIPVRGRRFQGGSLNPNPYSRQFDDRTESRVPLGMGRPIRRTPNNGAAFTEQNNAGKPDFPVDSKRKVVKTPHEILGIRPGATPQIINSAFRSLSRRYHPDVNPSKSAATRYAAITGAYSALTQRRV